MAYGQGRVVGGGLVGWGLGSLGTSSLLDPHGAAAALLPRLGVRTLPRAGTAGPAVLSGSDPAGGSALLLALAPALHRAIFSSIFG